MKQINAGALFNNKLTTITLPKNVTKLTFSAVQMNPLKGSKAVITKLLPTQTHEFGQDTKALQGVYVDSKYKTKFTHWNKVKKNPATLYVRWK